MSSEYELRLPGDANEWRAYHDIRRRVLWDARGLSGYDERRPDETAPGHHSRLLLFRGEPIGTIRIDIAGKTALFRRVAVRVDVQRRGHGRVLLLLAEAFAEAQGCSRIESSVAPDAVAFYRRCGFVVEGDSPSGSRASVPMSKLTAASERL
jgi:GNAT superfamily N-acetyltransferase